MELLEISSRIAALEGRMERELATRIWVRDALDATVAPMREALQRTEASVDRLATSVITIADQNKALNATQDQMMRERAERERAEHDAKMAALQVQLEQKSLFYLVTQKGGPLAGAVLGVAALFALLSQVIAWLLAHQFGVAMR